MNIKTTNYRTARVTVPQVLISPGIELISSAASAVLCFEFSIRIMLITH